MRDDLAKLGASHFTAVRSVHRELLERAMLMRCISYLADAKSKLLIQTVSTVGQAKRSAAHENTALHATLKRASSEMMARDELEVRLREITDVVDQAPVMLAIAKGGAITYANEAFCRAFAEVALSTSMAPPRASDVVPAGAEAGGSLRGVALASLLRRAVHGSPKGLEEALLGVASWVGEVRLSVEGGRSIWGRVRVSALGSGSDDARAVVFVEDVSKEREAEERVAQWQKTEVLGQLSKGVAHDFNNLLMVIVANAEALRDHEDPSIAEAAGAILESAAHGASLTQQLLASTRRQHLKPQAVDVNALLRRLEGLLSRTMGEGFTMVVDPCASSCVAVCDAGLLESAVTNLVLNARDASGSAGTIRVTAGPFHAPDELVIGPGTVAAGDYVRISVSDQGCGISEHVRDVIWEPYFTTKVDGPNSGLGLSMVLGFAQQSKGGVAFDTEVGAGTTFHLYLPSGAPAGSALATRRPSRGRLLLVEDDPAVQAGVCRLLDRLGFDVVAARGMRDAIAEIDTGKRFDVLLTDVVLRGSESGPALAMEIRRRVPALPIVFMSGYSHDAIAGNGALPEGRVEYLTKPFTKAALDEALATVMGTAKAAAR